MSYDVNNEITSNGEIVISYDGFNAYNYPYQNITFSIDTTSPVNLATSLSEIISQKNTLTSLNDTISITSEGVATVVNVKNIPVQAENHASEINQLVTASNRKVLTISKFIDITQANLCGCVNQLKTNKLKLAIISLVKIKDNLGLIQKILNNVLQVLNIANNTTGGPNIINFKSELLGVVSQIKNIDNSSFIQSELVADNGVYRAIQSALSAGNFASNKAGGLRKSFDQHTNSIKNLKDLVERAITTTAKSEAIFGKILKITRSSDNISIAKTLQRIEVARHVFMVIKKLMVLILKIHNNAITFTSASITNAKAADITHINFIAKLNYLLDALEDLKQNF